MRSQSQNQKKRNIFRASLRRQYIEQFQHSIRMKYLAMQRQEMHNKKCASIQRNIGEIVANLQQILKMSAQEICTYDNFQYFIQVIQDVLTKKVDNARLNTSNSINSNNFTYQPFENRSSFRVGQVQRNSNIFHNMSGKPVKNFKISSVWMQKQKLYSIIYRILDKSFGEAKGRLWYVIDQALYMLQFPELMPLWEKISNTNDIRSKNYCAKQFRKKLTSSSLFLNSQQSRGQQAQSILDPDFVLDILTNFIVQSPCIQFQNMLELMPFISYVFSLNKINRKSPNKKNQSFQCEQEIYPKLNKACIIVRGMLKEDNMNRLTKLVEFGFEFVIIFLIQQIGKIFSTDSGPNKQKSSRIRKSEQHSQMEEQKKCQSGKNNYLRNKYQCDYNYNSRYLPQYSQNFNFSNRSLQKRPTNLLILTKINLVKLLNRLFVANPHIATFLYLKTQHVNIFQSLFETFINDQSACMAQTEHQGRQLQSQPKSTRTSQLKYQFIILCDSHRLLLKNILSTLHTLLIAGLTSGHSFAEDFIRNQGIFFMQKCTLFQIINSQSIIENQSPYSMSPNLNLNQFSKQIANILISLDGQGQGFYNKLDSSEFKKLFEIQLQLISFWGNIYLNQKELKLPQKNISNQNQFLCSNASRLGLIPNSNANFYLQLKWCLGKILKMTRNSILIAFARATEPTLFQQMTDMILYEGSNRQLLGKLSKTDEQQNRQLLVEQQQIRQYSKNVIEACDDPKVYIQRHNNFIRQ